MFASAATRTLFASRRLSYLNTRTFTQSATVYRDKNKKKKETSEKNEDEHLSADKYVKFRKEQLSGVKEWYPAAFDKPTHTLGDIRNKYEHLEAGDLVAEDKVTVAVRIHSVRIAGKKLYFLDVRGQDSQIQVKAGLQLYGEQLHPDLSLLRRGDLVCVEGHPCRTKAGELSVSATKVTLLSPCLQLMANNHVEMENLDKRFRRRHVDFIMKPEKREIFKTRAKIVSNIRSFLNEQDFLEVETPVLSSKVGGASAEPFTTHHADFDLDMYLRIAPELYLKQLVIGGFERVYEIGKQFRNEGVDATHNPEFTTCELYMAWADYKDMMSLTGKMLRRIVAELHGEEMKVPCTMKGRPVVIDFKSKFNKYDFFRCIESALGKELPSPEEIHINSAECFEHLRSLCGEKVQVGEAKTCGKVLDKLFSHYVEPELAQPTFILDYPQSLSPLAKPHRDRPFLAERFELFIAGQEVANAYSELNDPRIQRDMFKMQSADENTVVDEDYVEALEYGLPPTGGWGMGIDRLTMILTDQPRLKEVLLFPTMKQIGRGVV